MLGKHKFSVDQRVRPSPEGIAALLFRAHRHNISGVVTMVDHFNCPKVRWDDRKSAIGYHADFIEPDRRKRARQQARGRIEDG